jgi:hypothetical protein
MTEPHVFIETNFLFSIFRLPSQRHRDALVLQKHYEAGEIKLYVPYLCFQEARNLISQNLPSHRCTDLFEYHRFADAQGAVTWDFGEARKLLDSALGEVSRTKAVYKRELAAFASTLGDGILHGTDEVFDFLETLKLDDDNLKNERKWFIDALILCSVLVKAKHLQASGATKLFFASLDKKAFQPSAAWPKLAQYYHDANLVFVPGFVLPDDAAASD